MAHHAATNPRRVEPKPREKGSAHTAVRHERRHKTREGVGGYVGDGATITGATLDTSGAAYPGVTFDSTGLYALDGSGTRTMFINAADGSITVYGSGIITGSTFQTSATNPRVVMDSSGIRAYDSLGNNTFNLAGGSLSVSGTSTVTGGTIQTSSTNPRVVLNSSGLTAYNSSGIQTMFIAASDGSVTISGNLTVTGTSTITGGTIQTSTGNPKIVMSTSGLNAYNSSGTNTFSLGTDGTLTVSGTSTITGGTFQTASANPRIIINSSGITAYNSSGTANFTLATDGTLTVSGTSTITGGTLQTATSNPRIVMNSSGINAYNASGTNTFTLGTDGTLTVSGTSTITGGTFRTGTSGARVVLDSGGLHAYNASNTQTVLIDATTGLITATGVFTNQPGSTVPWQTTGFFVGGGNLLSNSSAEDPTTIVQVLYMDSGTSATVNLVLGGTSTLDGAGSNTGWSTSSPGYWLNAGATQTLVTSPTPQFGADSLKVVATATMAAPTGLAAGTLGSSGGTWGATGTYYYKVTALNGNGETIGSSEISVVITSTAQTVPLSWAVVPNSTSYKVYRSTTSGGESTSPALVANPGVNSYTDTGNATVSGAVPASNTGVITFQGISLVNLGGITFTSGQAYTFSIYLYGNVGGELVQLDLGVAGTDSHTANFTLTHGWARYSVTWTPTSNETSVYAVVRTQGAVGGMTFFANAAQLEAGSSATSYGQGIFQLQYQSNPVSANLEANATQSQVQTALNAAGVLPAGVTVSCSGGPLPGTPIYITFSSSAGITPHVLSAVNDQITGGNAAVGAAPPGWGAYGTDIVTVNPSTGSAWHGGNVFQGIMNHGASGQWFMQQLFAAAGMVPGTSYTLSAYFKAPSLALQPEFEMEWRDSGNHTIIRNTAISSWTTTTSWQRLVLTSQVPPQFTSQLITITGGPTGGTFTLTYKGQTTAAINWNATAAAVQTALQALTNIGASGVPNISGGPLPGTPVQVALIGGSVSSPAQMTATSSLTGGSSPQASVSTLAPAYIDVYIAATGAPANAASIIYVDGVQLEVADAPTAFAPRGDEIVANTVQANMINVAQLSAISADLGTVTAGTIIGATLETSASAATTGGVIINSSGMTGYDSSGNVVFSIPAGSGTPTFNGTIDALGVTFSGSGPLGDNSIQWLDAGSSAVIAQIFAQNVIAAGQLNSELYVRSTAETAAAFSEVILDSNSAIANDTYAQLYVTRGQSGQPSSIVILFGLGGSSFYQRTLLDSTGYSDFVFTGSVMAFSTISIPLDWLVCDGSAKSRTTYQALFNALTIQETAASTTISSPTVTVSAATVNALNTLTGGTTSGLSIPISGTNIPGTTTTVTGFNVSAHTLTLSANATNTGSGLSLVIAPYGVGNGSTTFNLPDFRGTMPVGADPGGVHMPTHKPILGYAGGEESVTLTAAQSGLPAHNHTGSVSDGGHNHTGTTDSNQVVESGAQFPKSHDAGGWVWTNVGSGTNVGPRNGGATDITGTVGSHTHTFTTSTNTTGISITVNTVSAANASSSHDNMPPWLAVVWCIHV